MTTPSTTLNIEVVSTERLHAPNRAKDVRHAPLSIIDANLADFTPVHFIFLYDAVAGQRPESIINNLKTSLQTLLARYPQWCGRLHFNDYKPGSKSHLDRYGRFILSYGGEQEPGVEFVVARTARTLASLAPDPNSRAKMGVWDATSFPRDEFSPAQMLSPDPNNPDASCIHVQVTVFRCGGLAVDIKLPHALADGSTFSRFLHSWAALARGKSIASIPTPLFDPQRLDHTAEGDIDSAHADPAISQRARDLPCHRFDWWISGDDCPFPPSSAQVPEALKNEQHDDPETPIPWDEWDTTVPNKNLVLHFTGSEIKAMQLAARKIDRRISKQDAVVGHLWSCINRARGLSESDEPVFLNYALGLRKRTSPPLDESFVGSPILLTATSAPAREACRTDGLSSLAARLRHTVSRFTPDAVSAYIHDRIYDQSPQRLWQAFSGWRHVLVTSVIHFKFPELNFGFGSPRYVENVMPEFDGLFTLMEGGSTGTSSRQRDWSEAGVECQLHLPAETAARMLQDPALRRFVEQRIQSRL